MVYLNLSKCIPIFFRFLNSLNCKPLSPKWIWIDWFLQRNPCRMQKYRFNWKEIKRKHTNNDKEWQKNQYKARMIFLNFASFFIIMHNLSQFVSICLNLSRFVSICLDFSRFCSFLLFFALNTFFSIVVPGQFISIFLNFAFCCIIMHNYA